MKQILSDFIRRRTGMLIKCALIAVGFAAAAWIPLMFSGRLGGLVQARLDYRSRRGLRRRGFTAG